MIILRFVVKYIAGFHPLVELSLGSLNARFVLESTSLSYHRDTQQFYDRNITSLKIRSKAFVRRNNQGAHEGLNCQNAFLKICAVEYIIIELP